jgi:hypothetical protein
MRGQGFLGIACVFLIAGVSISCWVGEVEVKSARTTEDGSRTLETRQVPLETRRAPLETRRAPLETRRAPLETRRAPLERRQVPLARAPEESRGGGSEQAGICDPADSPIMIVVVESPRKVASASAQWKTTPILVQDPETVVFTDGRIVTSNIEATGDRLQSLGWAHRDIEIVSGLPAAAGAWKRRRG